MCIYIYIYIYIYIVSDQAKVVLRMLKIHGMEKIPDPTRPCDRPVSCSCLVDQGIRPASESNMLCCILGLVDAHVDMSEHGQHVEVLETVTGQAHPREGVPTLQLDYHL